MWSNLVAPILDCLLYTQTCPPAFILHVALYYHRKNDLTSLLLVPAVYYQFLSSFEKNMIYRIGIINAATVFDRKLWRARYPCACHMSIIASRLRLATVKY